MDEPRAKRPWRRKLLALFLSILVSLLTAEILARILVGAPLAERLPIMMMRANPDRGWMMVPGGDHYTYHHRVKVNSYGLRGPEIGAKAEGTVRVLVLGDSLVYGQGVGEDETLPALLREILTERDPQGRRWEVINGGHRGYDTRQEIALFEELGADLQPDAVLLLWFWNDLREQDVQAIYERLKDLGEVSFDTHDRVEGWSRVRWQAMQLGRSSALAMFLYDARRRLEETPWEERTFQQGLERLKPYLERFSNHAAALGCRPMFASIPDPNVLIGEHQSEGPSAKARQIAKELGLEPLDLRPAMAAFAERSEELPVIPFDGHYLPAANRAMAEALAAHLLAQ